MNLYDIQFTIKRKSSRIENKVYAIKALRGACNYDLKIAKGYIDNLINNGNSKTFTLDQNHGLSIYTIIELFDKSDFSVDFYFNKYSKNQIESVNYFRALIETALDDEQFETAKVLIDTLKQYK